MENKTERILQKINEMRNEAESNARKFDEEWKWNEASREITKATVLLELQAEVEIIIQQ